MHIFNSFMSIINRAVFGFRQCAVYNNDVEMLVGKDSYVKMFYRVVSMVLSLVILSLPADSITTLTGSQEGSLKEWPEKNTLTVVDKEGNAISSLSKEVFISWKARSVMASQAGRVFVRLTNGVGMQARATVWTEESVTLSHSQFGEGDKKMRTFSFEDVRQLIFLDNVLGAKREALIQKIKNIGVKDDDLLFLENDYLKGLLTYVDDTVLQFERNDKSTTFKTEKVLAVVLANPLLEDKRELLLKTIDGFEFPISSFKSVGDKISINSDLGPFVIHKNKVSSVTYLPKNRQFLGDIAPYKVEERLPGEDMDMEHYPFSYKVNRSVHKQQSLTTKKRRWKNGIGVHSDSKLTWKVPRNAKQLTGAVAIDNEAFGAGSVHFRIHTDGDKVFDSGLVTGEDEAKYFSVDLQGKKNVTLEVLTDPDKEEKDFTKDRADWLDLIVTLKN